MILVWNVRGAAGKAFGHALKEMRYRFKPKIVVLVEKSFGKWNLSIKFLRRREGCLGGSGCYGMMLISPSRYSSLTSSIFTATFRDWVRFRGSSLRREMWDELTAIADVMGRPWMLAGDFNDILSPDEQRGGACVDESKCKNFHDHLSACKLLDLGAEGPKYTWRGPLTQFANRLYKRLDRSVCNVEWRRVFAEAFVRVGPRLESDHHPLLIKISEE